MIEQALSRSHAAPVVRIHGGYLPGRVGADVLAAAEDMRALVHGLSPLNVLPDGLPGAVFLAVCPALKYPEPPGLPLHLLIELSGPLNTAGLAGLALPDGLPSPELGRPKLQHIGDPETGSHAQPHDEPISRHQCREYVPHLGAVCVGGARNSSPL